MTSPDPTRLAQAATAVGTDKPQLALTLASSDLSHSDMHVVGGFANALQLAAANRLAMDSGAATNFNAQEQNHLDGINEQTPNQPQPPKQDSRSFLEKAVDDIGGALSNTGSFLLHNPVTGFIETALTKIGDASHLPFRMLSSALDTGNDAEVDQQMRNQGYDPNSASSYIAFMFNKGESLYHNLDGLRSQFDSMGTVDWQGKQLSYVDLAVQQQEDPEAFQKSLESADPNTAAAITKVINSKDYQSVYGQVDQEHISPGRDIARLITFGHTNNGAFTFLSGTLDAAYTWFADPTLILGKVSAGIRAADALGRVAADASAGTKVMNSIAGSNALFRSMRQGFQGIQDQEGIRALLEVGKDGKAVTRVGKGWESFLDQAKQLRDAHAAHAEFTAASETARTAGFADEAADHAATAAGHQAQAAAVYANMQSRYGELMPILDAINGFRVPPLAAKFVSGEPERLALLERMEARQAQSATGKVLYHGGLPEGAGLDDINLSRVGTQQGKGGKYGGFYLTDESSKDWSEGYAAQRNGNMHTFVLRDDARIGDLGDRNIDRLSETEREMLARDHDVVQGKDTLGRTQYVLLNKNAVAKVSDRSGAQTATFDRVQNTAGGAAEVTKGAPIENLSDLADYLGSQDALLRINNGWAAREAKLMPGRLSFLAERKAAAADKLHLDAGSKAKKWIDYSNAHKLMPHDVEQDGLDALDAASLTNPSARAQAGDDYFNLLKKGTTDSKRVDQYGNPIASGTRANPLQWWNSQRARTERVGRRLTTMLPQVSHIDLEAPESTKTVEQFAKLYMNRGDAAMTASAYALGDMAARRQIVKGMLQQSFHASGLSRSAAGRKMMDDYLGDQAVLARQKYGLGETSQLATDSGVREVALYPDQLSTKVFIPSFKEMNYLAAKYAVGGFASRTGIASIRSVAQAPWMDAVMGRIKMGWITSAAGGLRNGLDEVANFMATGLGGDVLKARSLFTQVTKDMRKQRRDLSDEWIHEWVPEHGGQANAREALGEHIGASQKSYDDTKLELEKAQRNYQQKLEEAEGDENHPLAQEASADLEDAQVTHNDAKAELVRARGLENAIHYRIPLAFRRAGDKVNDVLLGATLGKLLSVRGGKYAITEDDIRYASELTNQELSRTMRDGVFQAHYADDVSLASVGDDAAMANHRVGLQARKYAYSAKFKGWGQVEADGGAGLDSWAKYLQLRFADPTSPAHVWAQEMLHSQGNVVQARDAVRRYMDEDVMRHFRENAEVTNTLKDGTKATTDDMRAQALDEYADRVSADLLRGLARRPGEAKADGIQLDPERIAKAQSRHDAALKRVNELPDRQIRARDKAERQHAWAQKQVDKHAASDDPSALEAATAHLTRKQEHLDSLPGKHAAEQTSAETRLANAKRDLEDAQTPASIVRATSGGEHTAGIHQDLLYQLAHSNELGVPDRSWLANNVPPEARPEHTIGQLWAPFNAKHEPGEMPAGYTPMLSQAYDKLVTDQINAISRNPLVTALYVEARKTVSPYEAELKAAGFTDEAAKSVVQKMALSHAETEAFKHIDNPYVSSQFSTISRNLWAFERAQEDWLRRWGRTVRDNPQIIRQTQLLLHGGTATGLVDKDDQGNLQFVYPGSGLALSVFQKIPWLGDHVQIPMTGELSSQLMFLNPSLDNPLGFSGTPLLSIPLKVISATMGAHDPLLMSSLDKAVNGQMGAGRQWYEMVLPSWANRIMKGVLSEDPASTYGAAYTQALFNMDAAGQLDSYRNGDASMKARLQHQLSTQVHNNLLANALFGFFAPAAPSLDYNVQAAKGDAVAGDSETGYRGNKADWSAHVEGLHSLKDEYRAMAARIGVDKANQWWAAVHPNELIYEQSGAGSRTQAGTTSASAPATIAAARWMEDNPGFLAKFGGKGGVATYFMPQGASGTKDGEYSDVAYRAQLESGMRQYKSLDSVFDDIVVARGEQIYYDAKDKYDKQISEAKNRGDNSMAQQLEDEWSQKKQLIYAGNPLLEQKNVSFAVNSAQQAMAVSQLQKLVSDPSPEVSKAIGANRDGVLMLLNALDEYNTNYQALSGRRGPYVSGLRSDIKDTYSATTQAISTKYPELADLVRGVFRTPN